MSQRSVPAPFLTKTYQMVDDSSTDDVISWGDNGTTFVVWKTAEFAKDLLPTYFKHNNFSSFVRQLNTYGFRKTVPEKWEFANDNFKRGEKGLLSEIRRRKTTAAPPLQVGKSAAVNPSQSSSGEDGGSTSTTSPDSKKTGSSSVEMADLSGENEKLRRENEMLSSELAQTKKQCEELTKFLTGYLKVGPNQINNILRQGLENACGAQVDGLAGDGDEDTDGDYDDNDNVDDDDEKEGEDKCRKIMEEEGLKLFGVWLKQGNKRGRCCDENEDNNIGLAPCGGKAMRTR